jgi:hypothetical protein
MLCLLRPTCQTLLPQTNHPYPSSWAHHPRLPYPRDASCKYQMWAPNHTTIPPHPVIHSFCIFVHTLLSLFSTLPREPLYQGRPTCIHRYATEYPLFCGKKFVYKVYACICIKRIEIEQEFPMTNAHQPETHNSPTSDPHMRTQPMPSFSTAGSNLQ